MPHKVGFRQFIHERLIPYRFDVQHPHYRRHQSRKFGQWVNRSKSAAFIVDRLHYYPIRYAPRLTQVHPFTPEAGRR